VRNWRWICCGARAGRTARGDHDSWPVKGESEVKVGEWEMGDEEGDEVGMRRARNEQKLVKRSPECVVDNSKD